MPIISSLLLLAHVILAWIRSADRKLEWLEHRIEVMSSLSDMYACDKTNCRLGRLTVLSAIFMPITFLAGIWGMNFENMPALSLEFGYVFAISSMIIIAGGMYLYFRNKGWFNQTMHRLTRELVPHCAALHSQSPAICTASRRSFTPGKRGSGCGYRKYL